MKILRSLTLKLHYTVIMLYICSSFWKRLQIRKCNQLLLLLYLVINTSTLKKPIHLLIIWFFGGLKKSYKIKEISSTIILFILPFIQTLQNYFVVFSSHAPHFISLYLSLHPSIHPSIHPPSIHPSIIQFTEVVLFTFIPSFIHSSIPHLFTFIHSQKECMKCHQNIIPLIVPLIYSLTI